MKKEYYKPDPRWESYKIDSEDQFAKRLVIRKKNGERWERRLSLLIKDICNKNYLDDLKLRLDRSSELRNMQVHPIQNSFSGPMGGIVRNIKFCVNVLNRLFREKKWHINQQEKIQGFNEVLAYLKNKLLVIEYGNKGGLGI